VGERERSIPTHLRSTELVLQVAHERRLVNAPRRVLTFIVTGLCRGSTARLDILLLLLLILVIVITRLLPFFSLSFVAVNHTFHNVSIDGAHGFSSHSAAPGDVRVSGCANTPCWM
jgi:hypothetical protein